MYFGARLPTEGAKEVVAEMIRNCKTWDRYFVQGNAHQNHCIIQTANGPACTYSLAGSLFYYELTWIDIVSSQNTAQHVKRHRIHASSVTNVDNRAWRLTIKKSG